MKRTGLTCGWVLLVALCIAQDTHTPDNPKPTLYDETPTTNGQVVLAASTNASVPLPIGEDVDPVTSGSTSLDETSPQTVGVAKEGTGVESNSAPTVSFSIPPTSATAAPTNAKTSPPTMPPTNPPTKAKTSPPTNPPTNPQTNPPTKAKTSPPTNPPTNPPTKAKTSPPTNPPNLANRNAKLYITTRKMQAPRGSAHPPMANTHTLVYDSTTHLGPTKPFQNRGGQNFVADGNTKYMTFDLWSVYSANGRRRVPFNTAGFEVRAQSADKKIVTVKEKVSVGNKKTLQLDFVCHDAGTVTIAVAIRFLDNSRHPEFAFKKHCESAHLINGLLMVAKGGANVIVKGKVSASYDINDNRKKQRIAGPNDGVAPFLLASLNAAGTKLGKPTVVAIVPSKAQLLEIAKKRPQLKQFVPVKRSSKGNNSEEYEQHQKHANVTLDGGDADEYEVTEYESLVDLNVNPGEVSDVCAPELKGSAKNGGILVAPGTVDGKRVSAKVLFSTWRRRSKSLDVEYHCKRNGVAVIQLNIPVIAQDGSQGIEKVSWLKICEGAKVVGGGSLMGFEVFLGAKVPENSVFYAIMNGVTTKTFDNRNHELVVMPEEKETSFYMQVSKDVWDSKSEATGEKRKKKFLLDVPSLSYEELDEDGKLLSPPGSPSNMLCDPELSGHAARGGVIDLQALPLVANYNCRRTGTALFKVKMKVAVWNQDDMGANTPRFTELSFSWLKHCEIVPLNTLLASTVSPGWFPQFVQDGIPVDSSQSRDHFFHSSVVIEKGVVDQEFQRAKHTHMLTATEPTIALRLMTSQTFKVMVVNGEKKQEELTVPLVLTKPTVSCSNSIVKASIRSVEQTELEATRAKAHEEANTPTYGVKDGSSTKEMESSFSVTAHEPIYLLVDHVCYAGGESVVTLTLPVPGQKSVELQWTKECSFVNSPSVSTHVAGFAVLGSFLVSLVVTSLVCLLFASRKTAGYQKMAMA